MYNNLLYSVTYKINQLKTLLTEELNSLISNNTIIYTILKNINIFEKNQNKSNKYIINLKSNINFVYSTIYNSYLFSTLIKTYSLYIKRDIFNNNDKTYNIKKWKKHKCPKNKKYLNINTNNENISNNNIYNPDDYNNNNKVNDLNNKDKKDNNNEEDNKIQENKINHLNEIHFINEDYLSKI